MAWLAAYVAILAVLFVRVGSPAAARRVPALPPVDEPFAVIRWHHRLAYAVFLGAAVEGAFRSGAPISIRWLGLGLMLGGVVLYRRSGEALGSALSPFLSPAPGTRVVDAGPYARIRHPMYLGQILMIVGAPMLLGARLTWGLVPVAVGVVLYRLVLEERRLHERLPGYADYVRGTKRLIPWVL